MMAARQAVRTRRAWRSSKLLLFTGVRGRKMLRSSPLEDASMLLPDLLLLAVVFDDVFLVGGVDLIGASSATHHVLGRGNVSGLDDVVATPPVEAIQRGVTPVADEVVPSPVAVDEVPSEAIRYLVRSAKGADLFGVLRTGDPLACIGTDDEGQSGQGRSSREQYGQTCSHKYSGRSLHVVLLSAPLSLENPLSDSVIQGPRRRSRPSAFPSKRTAVGVGLYLAHLPARAVFEVPKPEVVTYEYESLLYCHPLSSQPVVYRKECFGADIATQMLGGFFVSEGRRGVLHASGFRVVPTHEKSSFSCPKEASKGGCLPPGRCKIRCLRIHSAQEHRTH